MAIGSIIAASDNVAVGSVTAADTWLVPQQHWNTKKHMTVQNVAVLLEATLHYMIQHKINYIKITHWSWQAAVKFWIIE